jgi:hypothetical protein
MKFLSISSNTSVPGNEEELAQNTPKENTFLECQHRNRQRSHEFQITMSFHDNIPGTCSLFINFGYFNLVFDYTVKYGSIQAELRYHRRG